jgi:GxxExxY protein
MGWAGAQQGRARARPPPHLSQQLAAALVDRMVMEFTDGFGSLTERIIAAAMNVHSALGAGFGESVYEEALSFELHAMGVPFKRQHQLELTYRGHPVGVHRLDLLVEDVVVVELKAVDDLARTHVAQLLSYLRASNCRVGLLINFNVRHLRDGIRRLARPF